MSKKIDQFTELAAQPASGDLFLIELASNGQYRKLKYQNIIPAGSITVSQLAVNSVNSTKIDFGGAGAGVWWEEIGRVTLTTSSTTLVLSSLPSRAYLRVIFKLIGTASSTNGAIRFNNDSSSNYNLHISDNGNVVSNFTSQNLITLDPGGSSNTFGTIDIMNVAAQEKICLINSMSTVVSGAGNSVNNRIATPKWSNTTDLINRVDIINNGSGTYFSGSEMVILGHN